MKDDNSDQKAQDSPRGKRVLGKLPKGERDSEQEPAPEGTFGVQTGSPPGKEPGTSQPRRGSKPTPRASHRRTPRTDASDGDDKLVLPEDALVAMRRSGGLRFTSKGVVIYRDGRVATEGTGYGAARQAPAKRLDDEEFAELYRALDTAWGQGSGARDQGPKGETESFPGQPSTSGRRNPDGYAYDLAARLGEHTYAAEVFDGSIPEQLAPLLELLSRHMRPTRQARDKNP
jgi:hypothetical protein